MGGSPRKGADGRGLCRCPGAWGFPPRHAMGAGRRARRHKGPISRLGAPTRRETRPAPFLERTVGPHQGAHAGLWCVKIWARRAVRPERHSQEFSSGPGPPPTGAQSSAPRQHLPKNRQTRLPACCTSSKPTPRRRRRVRCCAPPGSSGPGCQTARCCGPCPRPRRQPGWPWM